MKKIKRANGDGSIWTEIRNGRVYYRGAATIEVDNNGKAIRKTVGGYDRQTVVKKLREFQVLADKNILIEPSDEVFADYFKHWIFSSKKEKIMAKVKTFLQKKTLKRTPILTSEQRALLS